MEGYSSEEEVQESVRYCRNFLYKGDIKRFISVDFAVFGKNFVDLLIRSTSALFDEFPNIWLEAIMGESEDGPLILRLTINFGWMIESGNVA